MSSIKIHELKRANQVSDPGPLPKYHPKCIRFDRRGKLIPLWDIRNLSPKKRKFIEAKHNSLAKELRRRRS